MGWKALTLLLFSFPAWGVDWQDIKSRSLLVGSIAGEHGTAVVVSDWEILTCNHVSKHGKYKYKDSVGRQYTVLLNWVDEELDLASYSYIEDYDFAPVDYSLPVYGEDIYVIGNPGIFEWLATKGIVSTVTPKYIFSDMDIMQGMSGAGVFNERNELLGILCRNYKHISNIWTLAAIHRLAISP